MADFPTSPNDIAARMTGTFSNESAILASPTIQNHAAFLTHDKNGILECVWFGGSLEGKSDICIYKSSFDGVKWANTEQLTSDPERSEQNPILFHTPRGRSLLLHTSQAGGNQDNCTVYMQDLTDGLAGEITQLPLPRGTFIRAVPIVRNDGAWLLPLFHCTPKNGARWTGKHDTASVAISKDEGKTWKIFKVPNSVGCVHMTLVKSTPDKTNNNIDEQNEKIIAFFRRRQADYIHRTQSTDGGQTWSTPTPIELPNNNSSIAAIRMSDGRLAICCNPINKDMSSDRRTSLYDELGDDERPDADGGCDAIWGVPRSPLVVAISDDDANSFDIFIEVHNSTGKCLSNNSIDGKNQELSYPAIIETPDGDLDVAFTLNRRAIAHVRIPKIKLGAST